VGYLGVLGAIVLGSGWLEFAVRTRVIRRGWRLLLSLLPVFLFFVAWDLYAVSEGHWRFSPEHVLSVRIAGQLPIEELLFFLVVPLAAVLTFEAVRSVKGWPVHGESGANDADPGRDA
jgi:lycopene cyclase domain-containing protein